MRMSKMSKTTEFGDEIMRKSKGAYWYNNDERIVHDCKWLMTKEDVVFEGIEGIWKWLENEDGVRVYTNTSTGEQMYVSEYKKYKKLFRMA